MSTARPNALQVALELAERQRDALRTALQRAQTSAGAAHQQMTQLETYAHETDARWGTRAGASIGPEVMFHHRHFMGRLDHAIGLQHGVLTDNERRVSGAQQALLAAELRLASLRKLVERRQHEADQHQLKRDQKQTDERAMLTLSNRAQAH